MPFDRGTVCAQQVADRGVFAELARIGGLAGGDIGWVMDDRDHPA
jgi:hypothetical protein